MEDTRGNKRRVLVGPVCPSPTSPFYAWLDGATVSPGTHQDWEIVIPPDGMIYGISRFTSCQTPPNWHYARVLLNGSDVWVSYGNFYSNWNPGEGNHYGFRYGDIITVRMINVLSYDLYMYWELDVYRWMEQ